MQFGSTLRLLRVDAGLSLRALARQVGVSGAYLSRVENGRDPAPTPDRLEAIADALDLPPDRLVELAHQTAPALTSYIDRVPAAGAFFLEVARRGLDADQIRWLRQLLEEKIPAGADGGGAVSMRLSELIGERMALQSRCSDMDEVIAVAAALCARDRPAASLAARIKEREATSSTVIGGGVAVPHAVIPGVPAAAALVTLAEPLDLGEPGDSNATPIALAVVLVSGGTGREHLERLASVARIARHGGARELRDARDPAEVLAWLRHVEEA